MISRVNKSDLFGSLSTPWPQDLLPEIRATVAASRRKLVVLDDDPTGTQTIYDLPVLTTWEVEALRAEFDNDLPCFYILTNSRSLPVPAAYSLNLEIARNLKTAAAVAGVEFSIVSRSDSTLRGHFPGETQALTEALGGFDAVIVIPYFEAGGRYTVGDVHYVAEGDTLIPAAETSFARDAAFGYRSSNLREWVAEKSGGEISAETVASVSINDLRVGGAKAVCEKLLQVGYGNICVVNAACPRDLEVFVQGLLAAETTGRRFLFRTAASFVAARLGLAPRPLWQPNFDSINWKPGKPIAPKRPGGLIVVGSYVPKTTAQLEALESGAQIVVWKINVASLLNKTSREQAIADAVFNAEFACRQGADVVIATSRELIAGPDAASSLDIGAKISAALVEVVQRLKVRPRYIIAKGGITSSDLATRSLGVKRAIVLGQILPGVSVWELGAETKFPDLPYIIFPGNVGGTGALTETVEKLK